MSKVHDSNVNYCSSLHVYYENFSSHHLILSLQQPSAVHSIENVLHFQIKTSRFRCLVLLSKLLVGGMIKHKAKFIDLEFRIFPNTLYILCSEGHINTC